MSSFSPELSFLQQLYEQDTLYLVPEPVNQEPIPVAQAAQVEPSVVVSSRESTLGAPALETTQTPAPQAEPATQYAKKEDIAWLGEALKGTYLLFEVKAEVFQKLPQHQFLEKVLAAVGLSTSQVKFGNLSPAEVHDVKQIAAQQQAQAIILFGQGLPVANLARMEFYRMYRSGESRFVLVDALEDIEKSVELKKKLWDVLQKIFLQQN